MNEKQIKKEIEMDLNKYLQKNFPSLEIKSPLFYNWDYGLRFEIGLPTIPIFKDKEVFNREYFEKALLRAKKLFEATFEPNDRVYAVFQRYSDGRQKIKRNNYVFKSITQFDKIEVFKIKNLYKDFDEREDNRREHYHRIAVHTKLNNIDYSNIINRAIHKDFGGGFIQSFFINIDKGIIYYLYDDRGLDIIAKDKNTLKKLYLEFNDWILDYNRKKIDSVFKNL